MTEPTVTYTWRIERLDAAPTEGELTNVVRKIHWRLFGSDGINTTDVYGDIPLGSADPADFTLFENLSEATVISWLEAAIDARAAEGEEEPSVAQLRTGLAGVLAARRTPAIVPMPVPW
jgi:hypothetical protein